MLVTKFLNNTRNINWRLEISVSKILRKPCAKNEKLIDEEDICSGLESVLSADGSLNNNSQEKEFRSAFLWENPKTDL